MYSLGKLFYWMVSDGKYISRENLSSAASERIVEDNSLVRFYLMRLVRGTVAETLGLRWTIDHLLEEVRITKRLIARVRCYEHKGEVILTDGFGLDDGFERTSSRSATSKDPRYGPNKNVMHQGRLLADHDIGTDFTVPTDYG